jgi:hypothetical protein
MSTVVMNRLEMNTSACVMIAKLNGIAEMPRTWIMNKSKTRPIRVGVKFHHIAKMAACEKLITLQAWIEKLIEKETESKKKLFEKLKKELGE